MQRRFKQISYSVLTRLETCYKGIAGETLITTANRTMINNFTSCVDATNSGAWINTFTIFASTIYGAIGTDSTLRTTVRWGSDKCG